MSLSNLLSNHRIVVLFILSLIEHVLYKAPVERRDEGDATVAAPDAVVECQSHLKLAN